MKKYFHLHLTLPLLHVYKIKQAHFSNALKFQNIVNQMINPQLQLKLIKKIIKM